MQQHTRVADCARNEVAPFYWPIEIVSLVESMFLVFTCVPGGVIVSESGLCCRVPVVRVTPTDRALSISFACDYDKARKAILTDMKHYVARSVPPVVRGNTNNFSETVEEFFRALQLMITSLELYL